jgi:hypothetical protein
MIVEIGKGVQQGLLLPFIRLGFWAGSPSFARAMSKATQFREPFSRPMKEQGPSSAVLADEAADLWVRDRRPRPTGGEATSCQFAAAGATLTSPREPPGEDTSFSACDEN